MTDEEAWWILRTEIELTGSGTGPAGDQGGGDADE